MFVWPLFLIFVSSLYSQETAIQEYCFNHSSQMNKVIEKLSFILVASDQVQKSDRCATVISSPHRRELIQSYIRRQEPDVQIIFSSAEIKRDPCQLKVERIKVLKSESSNIGIAQNQNNPLNASAENQSKQSHETMKIQTLLDFEFTVLQNTIKGTCRVVTPLRYDITIEVRKDPINIYPPVPPGTIINVGQSPLPKPQEVSKLQTSLQLSKGERVELGQIVKDLSGKNKNIDLQTGASVHQNTGAEVEQVFLSID